MDLIKFFIGLFLIIILSLLALPIFAKTVYEYNKYGTKTGYYVQNDNVTTYYDKYGSKQYQYKNGKVYDKYGKFVKQYR
jgi:uncharacterized protein YxeA